MHWLYSMTYVGRALVIYAFFSKAKMGIIMGIVYFFIEATAHDIILI